MTEERTYSPMQTVKRRFFAMRNGIIADTLRKAGSPFSIIFGLNLPQIADIAEMTGKDTTLAEQLWSNNTTRESMLLAPMIVEAESFTYDDARRWVLSVPALEVADILCHRLLRHLPFAWELAEDLCGSDAPLAGYTALRLAFNLVATNPDRAIAIASNFTGHHLAEALKEEALFLKGG
ncbi:MAG: DNA alkylation repair protein [Muribaculaceae bacterium]|nr:DNA alkylation repair protein [Muribaculaceae bacterium]